MTNIMETLYDVIFEPAKAMKDIAGGKKVKQAFIAFFVSTILPVWALSNGLSIANRIDFTMMISILHVFGSLLIWFTGAAVFGLTAELFGGQGSVAGLFSAMGFIHIPKLFAIPLWALSILLPPGVRPFWQVAGIVMIAIWTLYLEIAAIKGAYRITGSKAVLVLLFPAAVMLLMLVLAAIFLGVSAMSAMPARWL